MGERRRLFTSRCEVCAHERVVRPQRLTAAECRCGGPRVRAAGPECLSAASSSLGAYCKSLPASVASPRSLAESGSARMSRGAAGRPLACGTRVRVADIRGAGSFCFTRRHLSLVSAPSPSRLPCSWHMLVPHLSRNPGFCLCKEEGPRLPEPPTDVCGKGPPHLPSRQLPFAVSRALGNGSIWKMCRMP